MPRVYAFFATSLMLSRHGTRRDHPLRGLWTGLFINHVRGVKGGLRAYWGIITIYQLPDRLVA